MKKGQKLYIVDLESVSIFNQDALKKIINDDEKYNKTPFLYLMASYVRNEAMSWADRNFKYLKKEKTGNWVIYCFEYI